MSAISGRLMRRMDACLKKLDGKSLEASAKSDISESVDPLLARKDSSGKRETEEEVFVPSMSGLELDVFQVVTELSNVSTLTKLCEVSNVMRNLVRTRTLGLLYFLADMDKCGRDMPAFESINRRHHSHLSLGGNRNVSIFADLKGPSGFPDLFDYETSWKIMIGCWDVFVYMDRQDYVCVTAMKLTAGTSPSATNPFPSDACGKFCVLHFPRGEIRSYHDLMRILLPYNFNLVNGGSVPSHVFEIQPYNRDWFRGMASDVHNIDMSDLQGRSPLVLQMHRWLRLPHVFRNQRDRDYQRMKMYRWRWIPDKGAYLVTFCYDAGVIYNMRLVYAYIKCMEHVPEIDFVWIFTTYMVPLGDTLQEVEYVWIEGMYEFTAQHPVGQTVGVSTRYNVGHYHNLAFLLFDSHWGKMRQHDLERGRLERSFKEDGTLSPAPEGYDEDGWPISAPGA
jgi:hypothetical protein